MKRILVVDDEEMYRDTVANVLRSEGYEVTEAEDAESAIQVAQHQPLDLIVSDVMMGKLDGFGLIDRLRMDPATNTIPFVFMTGLSDKESMRKGMVLGADDFLVKPFSGHELLAAVEARLTKLKEVREEAERKLTQLRSSLSLALPHEIRTPLTSIIGFSELLGDEENGMTGSEIAQCGRMIARAGRRLQRLMENFVTYARVELVASDQKRIALLQKTQLQSVAQFIGPLCRKKAESCGRLADLVLELTDGPAAISEEYLGKILEELLDNAFKFSKPGSDVRVRCLGSDGEFILSIADRGRGMSWREIETMGAYVQFDRKLHEQQGTGLGLAIAKRLAEIHGGSLVFEPGKEEGLTVRLHLPVSIKE